MKNIKGFLKELRNGKEPWHIIHIVFVGCIALALAAAILGLVMLLPGCIV